MSLAHTIATQTFAGKSLRKTFLAFAAAFGAVMAAAPAQAGWFDGDYDGGGSVLTYYEDVRSANLAHHQVRIDGYCASACTMKLGARHACVSPDAVLMFHSARSGGGAYSAAGNTILMSVYPRAVRNWVRSHGALNSLAMTEMSGRQAIALGVRAC